MRLCLTILCLITVPMAGCRQRPRTAPPADQGRADEVAPARTPGPTAIPSVVHRFFPSARAALASILRRSDPLVLGVGELHQKTDSTPVQSALRRFASEMLPELRGRASDLVVETWVTEGRCGKPEKQVARKVEQSTKRPPETENEVLGLLRRAKALGIQPHILTVSCKEYEQLLDAKQGRLDFEKLLDLITRHLRDRTLKILTARGAGLSPGLSGREPRSSGEPRSKANPPRRPLVVVYGGALHNDLFPVEGLEMFSYGAALQKRTGGRYVELDLYVPELVDRDRRLKQEPFAPLMRKLGSGSRQVLLVERGKGSYILVLRRGVRPSKPAQK